jgi:hypothetical protein
VFTVIQLLHWTVHTVWGCVHCSTVIALNCSYRVWLCSLFYSYYIELFIPCGTEFTVQQLLHWTVHNMCGCVHCSTVPKIAQVKDKTLEIDLTFVQSRLRISLFSDFLVQKVIWK